MNATSAIPVQKVYMLSGIKARTARGNASAPSIDASDMYPVAVRIVSQMTALIAKSKNTASNLTTTFR